MLKIKGLFVDIDGKSILNGVDLDVAKGEIHALMGQNGSGKSTLAQTIMGSPVYSVSKGDILLEDTSLVGLKPNERSKKGVFLSFQYPKEIPGVSVTGFLRLIYNKSHEEQLSPVKFRALLKEKASIVGLDDSLFRRYINEGFSGGEKKKLEMVQMMILEPKLVVLDEVDSGLDVDALRSVSKAVTYMVEKNNISVLIITHYARILSHINPYRVHIMSDGKIVKSGTFDLAHEIEEKGYSIIE